MSRNGSDDIKRTAIERSLEGSGWDLSDPNQIRLESDPPELDSAGAATPLEYLLCGKHGTLAVLSAVPSGDDPYELRPQAGSLAEKHRAPFILLSNGRDHWFWNHERRVQNDTFRIEKLPSRQDLERLRLRNRKPPRPLETELVAPNYLIDVRPSLTLRRYQIQALHEIARLYDRTRQRSFLLEMAPGTDGVSLAAALIRRFIRTENADRVLFIADGIEAARGVREEFESLFHDFDPVDYSVVRRRPIDLLRSRLVVATADALLTQRRYRTEFTPFHFDLIIDAEAHRPNRADARECVQFFQATRIGLTASPKSLLKWIESPAADGILDRRTSEARRLRDVYVYFGCEPGQPTYRCDLSDVARDSEEACSGKVALLGLQSGITTQDLAAEGWSATSVIETQSPTIRALEKDLLRGRLNHLLCEGFRQYAQHDADGRLGRSLILAVNHEHATALTEILNASEPGNAVAITPQTEGGMELMTAYLEDRLPARVAVAVDFPRSACNGPALMNLGLMRPLFSPSDYFRIRHGAALGHRAPGESEPSGQVAPGHETLLLDFFGVCAYFDDPYDRVISLTPSTTPLENVQVASAIGTGARARGATPRDQGPTGARFLSARSERAGRKSPIPGIARGEHDLGISKRGSGVGTTRTRDRSSMVDERTYRGSFQRDLWDFATEDPQFRDAVETEDDARVATILEERFLHRPKLFYSEGGLCAAYGAPAPMLAYVYAILSEKPLPARQQVIDDVVQSIAARFNLRYQDQKWLEVTADLVTSNPSARRSFFAGDMTIFAGKQFEPLGGLSALTEFTACEEAFEALRQSSILCSTPPGE